MPVFMYNVSMHAMCVAISDCVYACLNVHVSVGHVGFDGQHTRFIDGQCYNAMSKQ
jgi:hypothetical protein